MSASAVPRLLAVTPGDSRDLIPWLHALANVGWPGLLIREPHIPPEQLTGLVTFACERFEFVAVHARCPGWEDVVRKHPTIHLHVPDDPTMVPDATVHWGASCHDITGLHHRFDAGAKYALLSPVCAPTSKPEDVRPTTGIPRFLSIVHGLPHRRPLLALGGMNPARHHALRAGGGHGSAVLGDLFNQPNPEAAARRACLYLP